jgi:hypothetical protein
VSGLEHEIVRKLAAPGRHWPAHRKRKGAIRRKIQSIRDAGESDQALDVVIAVGAPRDDAERQVDLGWRPFDPRSRH